MAILFLIYPLSNILEIEAGITAQALQKISDYLLPFFLYLFLLLLLTDVILIVNRITSAVSRDRMRKVIFSYRYFAVIITFSLIIVAGGVINFNTIRITPYSIILDDNHIRGKLRIAFVSDFHLEEDVPSGFVRQFVSRIEDINPDVLLYGGDIVEGRGENLSGFESILHGIKTKYGVYGVLGNHDRIRDYHDNFFTRSGIVLLRDSIVVIDSSFVVAGRNDSRNSRLEAANLLNNVPDLPIIMVDHRPTDYDRISNTSTDLVLSGHTHKGQLFPINLYLKSIYEVSHGYLRKNSTHFIVSSGIRLWGPRVRTTGKSEIVVVDLY